MTGTAVGSSTRNRIDSRRHAHAPRGVEHPGVDLLEADDRVAQHRQRGVRGEDQDHGPEADEVEADQGQQPEARGGLPEVGEPEHERGQPAGGLAGDQDAQGHGDQHHQQGDGEADPDVLAGRAGERVPVEHVGLDAVEGCRRTFR